MTVSRRHRNAVAGAGAAAIIVIGGLIGIYVGDPGDVVGGSGGGAVDNVLSWVDVERDLPGLPPASGWCSLGRIAEHCFPLNESSGDATDTGSVGGWILTPTGSPRQNVTAPVQIRNGSDLQIGETAAYFDGRESGNRHMTKTSVIDNLPDATNLVSVTVVFVTFRHDEFGSMFRAGRSAFQADHHYGVFVRASTGLLSASVVGFGGTPISKEIFTADPVDDGAWHCATLLLDGRTANAGRIFLDGANATLFAPATGDLTGPGTWQDTSGSGEVVVGNHINQSDAETFTGGIARLRIDYAAITLAQHQAICGKMWGVPSGGDTRIDEEDIQWVQTGAARCFGVSAATAACSPGGLAGIGDDGAGDIGTPIEKDSRTNRILESCFVDCVDWTCTGAAASTPAIGPDSSKTAYQLTLDATSAVEQSATGYGSAVVLFPHLWAHCDSGILQVKNTSGAGQWDIACATIAGAWREIRSVSDAAVTEVAAWTSDATGDAGISFAATTSLDASVWQPTLTEAFGLSVIPTASVAMATGVGSLEIAGMDNYGGQRGTLLVDADWSGGEGNGCLEVTSGTDVGRTNGDGMLDQWIMRDSASATAFACVGLTLDASESLIMRWDSTATVGATAFGECKLNGSALGLFGGASGWSFVTPSQILLHDCTAVVTAFKIENAP